MTTEGNKTRGVLMVELMIALVVFTLAVLPVLKLFSGGSKAALKHREYAKAVLIAQDTVEVCRGYNFDFMAEESQVDIKPISGDGYYKLNVVTVTEAPCTAQERKEIVENLCRHLLDRFQGHRRRFRQLLSRFRSSHRRGTACRKKPCP